MTPLEALLAAIGAGARLSAQTSPRKLIVEFDAEMSSDILAALREHRDWLIAHLLTPPKPPVCRACGRPQHEADYVCPDPTEADPDFPIAPGYVPPEPAPRSCPDCHQLAWWTRDDGGQVCGVCHPDPRVLLERWRASQEAPID